MGLALPLAAVSVAAQTPAAVATASKTDVGVGEPFIVEVKVSGPAGTLWTFPAETESDELELRTAASPPGPSGPASAASDTHRYDAAAFALGQVVVPAIPVKYRLSNGKEGETSTAPIRLKVVSALPKDPAQRQLADIREPQPLALGAAFWIACGAAMVLAAGVAAWRWRRRRPVAVLAVTPERPADAEARDALDRLAAAGLHGRGEYRPFYIALAEIVKRYLERRLGAPVLEMTSTETVTFLRDHAHGQGLAMPMRDLAGAADQVKFARGAALRDEAERHMAVARQMIDALEARLQPAPAAAGEKVA
jgi:hypothetical protein